MNKTHPSLLAVVALLVSGCAALAPEPPPAELDWKARSERLARLDCWELSAKLGIRSGEEAHGVVVEWVQSGTNYEIQLYGPLGVGSASIAGRPGWVTMQVSSNRMMVGRDPETLVEREFGWKLPLSNLVYWVRGLPAPGAKDYASLDELQRLAVLRQNGWHLTFLEYEPAYSQYLPSRILLTDEVTTVKFLVKKWKPGSC